MKVIIPIEFEGYHCIHCGYDLRGLSEARCPECGNTWTTQQIEATWDKPSPYLRATQYVAAIMRGRPRGAFLFWWLLLILLLTWLAAKFDINSMNRAY